MNKSEEEQMRRIRKIIMKAKGISEEAAGKLLSEQISKGTKLIPEIIEYAKGSGARAGVLSRWCGWGDNSPFGSRKTEGATNS